MSWCRDNIGVGWDGGERRLNFDSSSFNSSTHQVTESPYSLKSPIFSRPPKPNQQATISTPSPTDSTKSQNFNLSIPSSAISASAISDYLLNVIDSPGYSNLLPSFLINHFNPSVPDRPDVKYYSIAARTPELNIWHPLWLPKLILDATEQEREKKLRQVGKTEDFGNDGLVRVESAKWGEFLGIVDHCDHWQIRGSSRYQRPIVKVQVEEPKMEREEKSETGWNLQDLNKAVMSWVNFNHQSSPSRSPSTTSINNKTSNGTLSKSNLHKEASNVLNGLTEWIISRIPGVPSLSLNLGGFNLDHNFQTFWEYDQLTTRSTPSSDSIKSVKKAEPTNTPQPPQPVVKKVMEKKVVKEKDQVRLLYGVRDYRPSKQFDLEKLYVGLCTKLYREGF
jgi:triacylglycerol lipase